MTDRQDDYVAGPTLGPMAAFDASKEYRSAASPREDRTEDGAWTPEQVAATRLDEWVNERSGGSLPMTDVTAVCPEHGEYVVADICKGCGAPPCEECECTCEWCRAPLHHHGGQCEYEWSNEP